MAGLGTPELILTIVAVLLLYGTRKVPALVRGLDRGVKNLDDTRSDAK